MTPQQIVGIGLRLFAVWLAVTSVSLLIEVPAAAAGFDIDHRIWASRATGIFYIVSAVVLWFFPLAVAHKLVPRTIHDNTLSLQTVELARVGCALLGLWLFTKSAPAIVWFVLRNYLVSVAGTSYWDLVPEAKVELAVAAFELALAIVLVAKASAFGRLVARPASS